MSDSASVLPLNGSSLEGVEIHTIPDKFYGAALKAQVMEEKKPQAPVPAAAPMAPVKHSNVLPVALVSTILLLGIGGGFVYFNRGLLFPAPAQPVVPTPQPVAPPPVPLPVAPVNANATSTNPQSVIVSWADSASDETGFRVERAEVGSDFSALTSLPPNSASFVDTSVQPKTAYTYRIRAINTTGESDPSNVAAVTTQDVPPPPPVAPVLPPAGLDTDSDGLTDVEETLYGTDARTPDTDGDGFLDGNEVFHLYNPNGRAPARLADVGLIKSQQATIGWAMHIPESWTMTMDTPDGAKATIDSKHGETFVVTIEENPLKKPVVDWYLDAHPGVAATQILQYRSKGGYTGIIGPDLLTTYIPWGDKIFVFTYNLDGQTFINYRTTYSMMLNSLMLSGLPQISPPAPGTPLPFEPSATSSGTVVQPVPVVSTTSTDVSASSTDVLPTP